MSQTASQRDTALGEPPSVRCLRSRFSNRAMRQGYAVSDEV